MGIVVTSHPLAVEAGLEMLRRGGTAADAAVAAGAALAVVDPRSTGIGGDVYALYWEAGTDAPIVLAGAGVAPKGLTMEALRAAGHSSMPIEGPWTVTVPGVPAAWSELVASNGALGLAEALGPAIDLAEIGFVVTPVVSEEWAMSAGTLKVSEAASKYFLPGGVPPKPGSFFANPDLGKVLRRISADGPRAFYEGEIGERIAASVQAAGGPLTVADLATWSGPQTVEPICATFRDLQVYEAPPPGQGLIVLEALKLLDGFDDLPPGLVEHVVIECIKVAFTDAHDHVADPLFEMIDIEALMAEPRLEGLRKGISLSEASIAYPEKGSDTVYVAVIDDGGNCCSFIQSLYYGFGSGVGVEGTGIVLQNRGAGFTFDDQHPNAPAPGKQPFHTIIPAMAGNEGSASLVFGVVGGYMQPQGQVQILLNLLDGQTPQDALDAPRFRVLDGKKVAVEPGFGHARIRTLVRKGHEIVELSRFQAGGAQMIQVNEDRSAIGATDPRKDGVVGNS